VTQAGGKATIDNAAKAKAALAEIERLSDIIESEQQTAADFHPLANLFPLLDGTEFEALVADIEKHGCREPIHTLDGKVLDGRNRWRACQQLGITPEVIEYTGNDPAAFVISLNLRRRHLNESQRAMVAAELATLQNGQRKSGSPIGEAAVTQGEAGKTLNVSKRQVERARKVRAKGSPELIQAVEQGEVSVSAAAEIADQPKAEQKKIVKKGKPAVQAAAKKSKAKKKTTKKAKTTPKSSDAIEPRHKEYMALPKDKLILELVALMHDAGITVDEIRAAFESVST
jgi:ParB-like chromosome segregation protein Spo0J